MSKALVLGNGNILVGMDQYAQVTDFYFPHVGLEEQVGKHLSHKIGVWVDGNFSWLDDNSWEINIDYQPESLASKVEAFNHHLAVKLEFCDVVYNETDIFLREVKVYNLDSNKRTIKLFFHQKFEISESYRADTAFFDPIKNALVHYKGRRVFLINAVSELDGFDDYSVGNFDFQGKSGTFKDAEDGVLSKNPIEHGLVDSVIGFTCNLDSEESKTIYYWIAAGKEMKEVAELNNYIFKKTPQHLIKTTIDFWRAWVNKQSFNFCDIDPLVIQLFKKNLLLIRTQVDNGGAIIASSDSDMLQHGKDNYTYMWPRDGALVALALDSVGDNNIAKRFFEFCNHVITDDGYFMHKYLADESLGSSWHPWVRGGELELPIQEDETALVIFSLRQHFEFSKDLEFIESVYNSLLKKGADFMMSFRDPETGLPKSSYDLWEEKFGVHTFSAASVYGALNSAAEFAEMLGKIDNAREYRQVAEEIKAGILKYLYDEEQGYFYKMLTVNENGERTVDKTCDMSSAYGIFKFKVLDASDEKLAKAMKVSEVRLTIKNGIGGLTRYENDYYYRVSDDVPGNPWFITSLWLAQYQIATAKDIVGLKPAYQWLEWVVKYATKAGIISEQLNPFTGEELSASPLTWSSAEFVMTVLQYLKKLETLGVCADFPMN